MTTLKILYLDDEPVLCELFAEQFTSEDVQVNVFTDPQKAIDAAWNTPTDIAILDFRLPEMNGDRVAHLMPPHIPKYLVTGDIMITPNYPFMAVFNKPAYIDEVQKLIDSKRPSTTALPQKPSQ